MQRSEINLAIARCRRFFRDHHFALPPFAEWTPADWVANRDRISILIDRGLGWDVTDFGSGDYASTGLALFTLRNGCSDNGPLLGMMYAEKALLVEVGQITPMHFHWIKAEDIINRGGGRLAVRIYESTNDQHLARTSFSIMLDGMKSQASAGDVVVLQPGSSVTIPPRLYHSFWAEEEPVLVGEVSTVNNDNEDNRFLEPATRFAPVHEDEPPQWLLVSDYPKFLG